MRLADYILQYWRIALALPMVPGRAEVLDIGCFHGEFFKALGGKLKYGVGLDPLLDQEIRQQNYELRPEPFREPMPFQDCSFDAVVMLATLEHISEKDAVARECARVLRPGGVVIITVPEPLVDRVVDFLVRVRLADGMSLEQHHNFLPRECIPSFENAGLSLRSWRKFQFGLNNLILFEKDSLSLEKKKTEKEA